MTRVLRCGWLVAWLMLVLACGIEHSTAPGPVTAPPTTTQPPQPLPPGEPVAIYVFSGPLDYAPSPVTKGSQYLLYDDGVFGLRYDAFSHVFLGVYRQDNDTITFQFDDKWTSDGGDATGTLKGELLEVRYSEIMQHSDFENAVYRRSR